MKYSGELLVQEARRYAMHILELKSHAAMSNENVLIQGIEIEINKIFTLCYSGIKLLKSVADLRNTIFERTRGQNFSLFLCSLRINLG